MENSVLNGLAPFQQNGHDHPALGHEVANDLHTNNLLMEEVLKAKEQEVPTAKMESPEAEIEHPDAPAKKKTKKVSASSISNTLTHCMQFIAAGRNMGSGYATRYAAYELTSLELTHATGTTLVSTVSQSEARYRYGVTNRKDLFGPLEARLTRILAEFILSGASAHTVEQIRSLIRKLRGARAVAKNPNVPAEVYHSVSQQNYDDVVANLDRLILMVAEDANYDPMAPDLTVLSLETTLGELRAANNEVIDTKAELDAARSTRNDFFNTKVTGLVDVFLTAKKVVLANFGTKSEEYKRVKGLTFRRIY